MKKLQTTSGFRHKTSLYGTFDLSDCLSRLNELLTGTDAEFNRLSEGLKTSFESSGDISKDARILSEEFGTELKSLNKCFHVESIQFLEACQKRRGFLARKNEDLLQLEVVLRHFVEPLNGFRRIVKSLLALHVATKVEGSICDAEDILLLAVEMRSLAEMIMAALMGVEERVASFNRDIKVTRLKADRLNAFHSDLERLVMKRVEESLSDAELTSDRVVTGTSTLAGTSQEISASIGKVVYSMQFHDITRQQIEHVQSVIEDLISDADRATDSISPAVLSRICAIQSAQLSHAGNEMTSAIDDVTSQLEAIADRLGDLYSGVQMMTTSTSGKGRSHYGDLLETISPLFSFWSDGIQVRRALDEAISTLSLGLSEISHIADELERITALMKTVAVNAGIRSINTVSGGKALSVIADEIQGQSAEALELCTHLVAAVARLKSMVSEMDCHSQGSEHLSGGEGDDFDSLQNLISALLQRDSEVVERLDDLEKRVASLREDVRLQAMGISVGRTFARAIDELLDLLDQGGSFEDVEGGTEDDSRVRDLLARYTMQTEREIHQDGHAWRPSVVPKKKVSNKPEVFNGYVDFGDNIELF